jgi:ATP-binding cassette, subfamily B (MDR/TAP), member 1
VTYAGEELANVAGGVAFKNVEFSYPSRPESPIFVSFSLRVPVGRTVALVGSSGSGKSTVIALLQRFYDPSAGEVMLDGVDVRRLRLKWLRAQMGLVSQEPALFATTVHENILFGKEDATMEVVVAAAKAANAHSFISQLPQGYDTQVTQFHWLEDKVYYIPPLKIACWCWLVQICINQCQQIKFEGVVELIAAHK